MKLRRSYEHARRGTGLGFYRAAPSGIGHGNGGVGQEKLSLQMDG